MILLILPAFMISKGQSRHSGIAGIDITSMIRTRNFGICGGISVSDRWSVCAGAYLRLPANDGNRPDITHMEDLGIDMKDYETVLPSGLSTSYISAQFWPTKVFSGPVISFGVMTDRETGPDFPISAGYLCRIWKGLGISVRYEVNLLDTINEQSFKGNGLSIAISYQFNQNQ